MLIFYPLSLFCIFKKCFSTYLNQFKDEFYLFKPNKFGILGVGLGLALGFFGFLGLDLSSSDWLRFKIKEIALIYCIDLGSFF
jgi:hypothetical protein